MGFEWERPPEQAFGEMADAYAAAVHQNVVRLAERYTDKIETWMKQNAPWTDRTGQTRAALYSDVLDMTNEAVVLILGHGEEKPGIFLELANAGRYSVVFPALDHFLPLIWRDIQAMLNAMSKGRFVSG